MCGRSISGGELGTALCLSLVVSFVAGRVVMGPVRNGMRLAGLVRSNYSGNPIPTSLGVALVASAAVGSATASRLGGLDGPDVSRGALACLVVVLCTSLAGFVDDLFGSEERRGFAGHLGVLVREGKPTTGILKAVVTWFSGACAISFARGPASLDVLIIDATIVGFSANFMNLLDLRPARAAKGFLVGVGVLTVAGRGAELGLVPAGLAGAVIAALPDELEERSMMGDAGANPLGAALGYWVALGAPFVARALALALLIGIHLYAERHSITKAIEANPLLRFLDELGRKQ